MLKIKNIFNKITSDKKILYLICISILLLLSLLLNTTFSLFTESFNQETANVKVGKLKYNMIINEVSLNGTVGTEGNTNVIIGDRVLLSRAESSEGFEIELKSLNTIDTKYEISYKVCSNANCTSFITTTDVKVHYSSNTDYPITGDLGSNETKTIKIVTENKGTTNRYILITLNAGYGHNPLILENKIVEEYGEGGGYIFETYIDEVRADAFPSTNEYFGYAECYYKDTTTLSTATGIVTWNNGWSVDITGLEAQETVCKINFHPIVTYDMISANYECANSSSGSDPIMTYSGNCTLEADTNVTSDGWKIKFTSEGDLTFTKYVKTDIFMVGGGGGGGKGGPSAWGAYGGGGGGSGYFDTYTNIYLKRNQEYNIFIGQGGSSATAGGTTYINTNNNILFSVNGGNPGNNGVADGDTAVRPVGGTGGRNGGAAGLMVGKVQVAYGGAAGSDGVYAFNGTSGNMYAGGGGGGNGAAYISGEGWVVRNSGGTGGAGGGGAGGTWSGTGTAGTINTGGGGGGGSPANAAGGAGGSGIIIIRSNNTF